MRVSLNANPSLLGTVDEDNFTITTSQDDSGERVTVAWDDGTKTNLLSTEVTEVPDES